MSWDVNVLVVGGGAAGMAAALALAEAGASVVMADPGEKPGGILNRCVHRGFGQGLFGEDLTGQEYAARFRRLLRESSVTVRPRTTVLSILPDRTAVLSGPGRLEKISFERCILAAGSYERTPQSLLLGGTRPAGVYTAGCVQGLVHEYGQDIGQRIVFLGSGDVGQILAAQLAAAGKQVLAMVEQKDRPGGLPRNRREYLEAANIPLTLQSTVTRLHGDRHLTGVTICHLPTGKESFLSCDTLITATGLIPDRRLADPLMKDGKLPEWLIPVGNCRRIYDIVDVLAADSRKRALIPQ